MENFRDGLIATKNLEYLDLSMTLIDNLHIALEGLVKNKSLKYLNLTSCKLPPNSVAYISQNILVNPNLRVVKLKNNPLFYK